MPLINPYCTLGSVQDEIRNLQEALIPSLEDAINAASRWIDRYKGLDFFEHDHSTDPLMIDAIDQRVFGNVLFLAFKPVIELTGLSENGSPLTVGSDFVIRGGTIIKLTGCWKVGPTPDKAIVIQGRFGYSQHVTPTEGTDEVLDRTTVPQGMPPYITRAAILIAAALSGQNRKEVISAMGIKETITDKKIPDTVFILLGAPRAPLL